MRITGGDRKGILLKSCSGIRPLTSSLRTSLFDMLANYIVNSFIIDFFAGAGTFGIEALSRGASFCAFIESNKTCLRMIRENLKFTGYMDRSVVLDCDVFNSLSKLERLSKKTLAWSPQATLCFFDPPYRLLAMPRSLKRFLVLLGNLLEYDIIHTGAMFLIKHVKHIEIEIPGLEFSRAKLYGETQISFFRVP